MSPPGRPQGEHRHAQHGASPVSRTLLLVNPNTTEAVTALLRQHVQEEAGAGVRVQAVTARFGAPYISDEAGYAIAGHAALDACTRACSEGPAPGAMLIACFGDPGLFALREASPVPVSGLAEASFAEAARHGRFAIVTGGAKWPPILQRLAQALGCAGSLAGVHTVAPTGAQLMADAAATRALLAQACREAAARYDAQALILGGASLAGVARDIQGEVPLPLIDSVRAGARWARQVLAG